MTESNSEHVSPPSDETPKLSLGRRLWNSLNRLSVFSVFVLVILWNILVSSKTVAHWLESPGAVRETLRETRDVNVHLQLRFYQLLMQLPPYHPPVNDVRLAYIDDQTHWNLLKGAMPTDRTYLAQVIRHAAQSSTKATAIGLDIEMLAPLGSSVPSEYKDRQKGDLELLEAIQFAASQGVTVVVAAVAVKDEHGKARVLPNVFADEDILHPKGLDCAKAACPMLGYINLPEDKREISTEEMAVPASGGPPRRLDSFALALARTKSNKLPDFSRDRESTLGTFSTEDEFDKIPLAALHDGDPDAELQCRNRIVLIGGNWHNLQGYGEPVDEHLSPAGMMTGLGLHANYLQSLITGKHTHELPVWVDILIDLVVGLLIYFAFEAAAQGWQTVLVLVGTLLVPLIAACALLLGVNLYLDFVLPIELYFIHILYEFAKEHITFGDAKSDAHAH